MSTHDYSDHSDHSDQHDQHDSAGAYVVGALQPDDAASFETHLVRCADCRDEVLRLREVAAELSFLAAAPPPPPGLRTSVLAAIPGVAQLPPIVAPTASRVAEERDPGVVDLAEARRIRLERRTRVLSLLVAAVSVLALALGGVVVSLSGRDQAPVATAGPDAGLLAAPDARIVRATLADGTAASFVVSKSQNRAMFAARTLPDPGAGRTYQLWTLRDGKASPDSTVGGGTDVTQWFHGPVAEADQLAVTIEPAGGSTTPTLPILASGTV